MGYTITTELECDRCLRQSGEYGAVKVTGRTADKREVIRLAREAGWWVYGNGETMLCPSCAADDPRVSHRHPASQP